MNELNFDNNFVFKTESNISIEELEFNKNQEQESIQTPNNKINRFKINKPNVHVQFLKQDSTTTPTTPITNTNSNFISSTESDKVIPNTNKEIFEYINTKQYNYDYISEESSDNSKQNNDNFASSSTNSNTISNTSNQENTISSDINTNESGSENSYVDTTSDIENMDNLENLENSDELDDLEGIEDFAPILEKKYFEKNLTKERFHDEIKNIKLQLKFKSKIDLALLDNNYNEITGLLEQGETIYQSNANNIVRLCGNKDHSILLANKSKCICGKENIDCNKTVLYNSLKNTNRGIKTLYYLLLKLLIIQPNLRNLCKCCEDKLSREYLSNLEKNFQTKKTNIIEDIETKLEPTRMIELQINYLINKFMGVIGLLPCECKFKNKFHSFYQDNFLNFKDTIKIYTKTIPLVIKILKIYYKIKDNHEELSLIKDSRCIHEDIRFNNITYCMKKNYSVPNQKVINEIVMKIDIINTWLLESIKIGIHLFNQQSLEYFRYILVNISKSQSSKSLNISGYFDKTYPANNELLDLNYTSNKKNIITSIVEYYNINIETQFTNLVPTIKNQFDIRNNKSGEKYNINDIFIYYIIECFRNNLVNLGLEFLKNIKNLKYKKELEKKIEYIFNTLLTNEDIGIKTKVSYLKIINKNKINIIEYDILNKLIDIELGDKIILEFNKDENSLFNINDYKNPDYIFTIIKRCIINNKVNILDYLLYNLDSSIKTLSIEPVVIYLIHIPKKNKNQIYIDSEYEYIKLLETILKYNYNLNLIITDDKDEEISLLEYCIQNELNLSAKLLINSKTKLEPKLLIKCIETYNHIILGYMIEKSNNLLKTLFDGFTLINYLFWFYENKKVHDDIIMRFLLKIINPIIKYQTEELVYLLNYQDEQNELFGMKILNSRLENKNKIILFSLTKDLVNPLKINKYKKGSVNTCNFPLIMYSMLLNQVEITYLFLNNLFKNKIIKKTSQSVINLNNHNNQSQAGITTSTISSNSNNNPQINTIFDYYHININNTTNTNIEQIEFNFVPFILKFIQDNYKNNFDENFYTNKKIILNSDSNTIEVLLFAIGLVIYFYKNEFENLDVVNYNNVNNLKNDKFINIKNDKIKSKLKSKLKNNNISKTKLLNSNKSKIPKTNGYVELTVGSESVNLIETDSIVNQVKKNNEHSKSSNNKNIWISSTKNTETQNRNYSTSSSISESEIFFN